MALCRDLGLDKTAKVLGFKRRFFGFESNRSLAARVVERLEVQDPIAQLFDGLSKAFEPRRCTREEHIVHHAGGQVQNEWIYHYNDGTEESVRGPWL